MKRSSAGRTARWLTARVCVEQSYPAQLLVPWFSARRPGHQRVVLGNLLEVRQFSETNAKLSQPSASMLPKDNCKYSL